jgi:hypothetical protein
MKIITIFFSISSIELHVIIWLQVFHLQASFLLAWNFLGAWKMHRNPKMCMTAIRNELFIKIWSMRCIKLAQKTPGAKISAKILLMERQEARHKLCVQRRRRVIDGNIFFSHVSLMCKSVIFHLNNILDLVDFWNRGEYDLGVVKFTLCFFESTQKDILPKWSFDRFYDIW